MESKVFTFKYEPTVSLKQMGEDIQKVVKTGRPLVNLHQISFSNIEDIIEEVISARPKLVSFLAEKHPSSLHQLAKLLHRNYDSVYKDAKSLAAMGIIELQKQGQEIKPIALYERIKLDLGISKKKKKNKELPLTFRDLPAFKKIIDKYYNVWQ